MGSRWTGRISLLLLLGMALTAVAALHDRPKHDEPALLTVAVSLVKADLSSATYELKVANVGRSVAPDVELAQAVPSLASFASSTQAPTRRCATVGRCVWDLGDLGPDSLMSLRIRYLLDGAVGRVQATAVATSGSLNSFHTNSWLVISHTPLPQSYCSADDIGRGKAAALGGRRLTGGMPLEKVWDARVACDRQGRPPMMITAAQAAGPPTCVDADPETITTNTAAAVRLDAMVTDGTATNRTAAGEDSCNGNPVANVNIEWNVEEDVPDAYFSATDNVATSGQPNTVTTVSDSPSGRTFVLAKLVTPTAGDNRFSARIQGSAPVNEVPEDDIGTAECALPPPIGTSPCPGQAANEDDLIVTWSATAPLPSQSASASPTPTTTTTSSVTPTPTTTVTPTTTSSVSRTPTPSRSPSPTQSGPGLARTVTLGSSEERINTGAQITFAGRLFSTNPSCDDLGETVEIRQRILGQGSFDTIATLQTAADGSFSSNAILTKSADFIAVAPSHDVCTQGTSQQQTVLVRVKVSLKANDPTPKRGGIVRLSGRVVPDHNDEVVLQRRNGKKWVPVAKAGLSGKSTYVFKVKVDWKGKRIFRVKWRGQEPDNAPNKSRPITVAAH